MLLIGRQMFGLKKILQLQSPSERPSFNKVSIIVKWLYCSGGITLVYNIELFQKQFVSPVEDIHFQKLYPPWNLIKNPPGILLSSTWGRGDTDYFRLQMTFLKQQIKNKQNKNKDYKTSLWRGRSLMVTNRSWKLFGRSYFENC